jgi:hypothetical protein
LRARVDQYYHAFMAGKYKQAYLLVADDSQDAFLEVRQATIQGLRDAQDPLFGELHESHRGVESCKSEWKWHGIVTPTTFPITSHWEVVDGQWYWHYVKPPSGVSVFSHRICPACLQPIRGYDRGEKGWSPCYTGRS